jgi:hypothetical protein
MAAYVYEYLQGVLRSLWRDYARATGRRGKRDQQRYYHGVLVGFREKLHEQDRTLATRHQALVWKGDAGLRDYFRYHFPRVRTVRAGGGLETAEFRDGKAAGRHVTLRKPVDGGPTSFGGLLTGP